VGVNHKCRIRSSILVEKVNAKKIDLTPIIYTEQGELGAIENALEPTSPFFTDMANCGKRRIDFFLKLSLLKSLNVVYITCHNSEPYPRWTLSGLL